MSTNVALPFSQWTPVATNVLNASGNFTITATNAVNRNIPKRFYIGMLNAKQVAIVLAISWGK